MRPAAMPVTLTASERKILKRRVRGAKTPYRDRLRAQAVLAAARGRANERIAADLRVSAATVRKWRGRFALHGLGGLGGPSQVRPAAGDQRGGPGGSGRAGLPVPAATGVPLSRWSGPEAEARTGGAGPGQRQPCRVSSLLRIWRRNRSKPWQYQSWIFPLLPVLRGESERGSLHLYQDFLWWEAARPRL